MLPFYEDKDEEINGYGLFAIPLMTFNYGDIRYRYSLGGGSLFDLGSYCISFIRFVLDLEPKKVFANQGITKGRGKVDQILTGFSSKS